MRFDFPYCGCGNVRSSPSRRQALTGRLPRPGQTGRRHGALDPTRIYSRRALRRARLLIQMRVLEPGARASGLRRARNPAQLAVRSPVPGGKDKRRETLDSPALYLLAPVAAESETCAWISTGRRAKANGLTTVVDTIVAPKEAFEAFAWRPRGRRGVHYRRPDILSQSWRSPSTITSACPPHGAAHDRDEPVDLGMSDAAKQKMLDDAAHPAAWKAFGLNPCWGRGHGFVFS